MRLFLGLALSAVGTVATLRARLGVAPWDVLHDGVRRTTPLTFGQAVIVVGLGLLVISILLGIRPGAGTIANMTLVGLADDLLLRSGVGGGLVNAPPVGRAAVLLGGVTAVGFGAALYISAGRGAGPRDAFQLALSARTRLSPGVARLLIEGTALMVGVLLGGDVGAGTVASVLLIGPIVGWAFVLLRVPADGGRRRPGRTDPSRQS